MYHSSTKTLARTIAKKRANVLGAWDSGDISPKNPVERPERNAHIPSIAPVKVNVFLTKLTFPDFNICIANVFAEPFLL